MGFGSVKKHVYQSKRRKKKDRQKGKSEGVHLKMTKKENRQKGKSEVIFSVGRQRMGDICLLNVVISPQLDKFSHFGP